MSRAAVVVAIFASFSGLASLAGCPQTADLAACTKPDIGHVGPDGRDDECHCQTPDAGDVGEFENPLYCSMYLASGKDGGGDASPEGP